MPADPPPTSLCTVGVGPPNLKLHEHFATRRLLELRFLHAIPPTSNVAGTLKSYVSMLYVSQCVARQGMSSATALRSELAPKLAVLVAQGLTERFAGGKGLLAHVLAFVSSWQTQPRSHGALSCTLSRRRVETLPKNPSIQHHPTPRMALAVTRGDILVGRTAHEARRGGALSQARRRVRGIHELLQPRRCAAPPRQSDHVQACTGFNMF